MLELKVRDGKDEVVLQFEHSLLSLSKWESKTRKPFLTTPMKDATDMVDYFQDMLLNPIDKSIVFRLSPEQLDELSNYISDSPTASSVPDAKRSGPAETVTSELIYYWMTALKINWAAETWHLNRLMMLIQITNYKSQPEKKKSNVEMMQSWSELNERNKKRFGTDG